MTDHLRDRIAAALYERERPPRDPHWPDAYAADREVFEAMAAAVCTALLATGVDREHRIRLDDLTSDDFDRYGEVVGEMNETITQAARDLAELRKKNR
ncbi:hypothetical protein PYK79_48425 [Streptomyces sp. ID05-04B]|uniref:hypothetical protein n=1 Tax=Streptomyces sp. ID05-04B TaxID=3028661 RepID=UPI0029C47B92|nr:hypothetical protein [Streptomyces sp. ID05-04B]MDX5569530.1 hypothetical protein [Streptomyces sp. ID05-04B]